MYQAALAMVTNAQPSARPETFPFCKAISESTRAEGESRLSIAYGDEVTLYDRCPITSHHFPVAS